MKAARWTFLSCLLSALMLLLAGCADQSDAETVSNVILQRLDGQTVDLGEAEGQPVLLNFWATWCAPCRVEMPLLQDYYDRHQDEFVFYAINMSERTEAVQAYLEEGGYTFPIALDPDSALADQLGVRALPVTLIFYHQGALVYRHTGGLTEAVLEAQLTPLLAP